MGCFLKSLSSLLVHSHAEIANLSSNFIKVPLLLGKELCYFYHFLFLLDHVVNS